MAKIVVEKFCCYFSLRNGCIIIGILGFFGRLIFGLGDAIVFIGHKDIFDKVDDLSTWHIVVCIANGLVGITAAAIILHGAFENNQKTIKIYLFLAIILILLIFTSLCIGIATLNGHKLKDVVLLHNCDENCQWTVNVTIYILCFDVIDIICYTYFLICTRSFYCELGSNSVYNVRAYI